MRSSLLILAGAALLAGCTQKATPPAATGEAPAAGAPQASAGAASASAQTCVELNRIREARVIDDQTIDFHLNNDEVLRNRLPNRCPQLGFERAFSYSTSLTRLCSTDIITVIVQAGGPQRGASCGLGQFTPVPAGGAQG